MSQLTEIEMDFCNILHCANLNSGNINIVEAQNILKRLNGMGIYLTEKVVTKPYYADSEIIEMMTNQWERDEGLAVSIKGPPRNRIKWRMERVFSYLYGREPYVNQD